MDMTDAVAGEAKEQMRQQPVSNVGMALREAREGLGMSVHDIAERIKFAPRQVEALEANDFANLPKATFLRGFVRSYARVLQLDEAALIAALPTEPVPQPVVAERVINVSFPGLLALQRVNLMWLGGALGVVLVLGLFMWLSDGEPVQKPSEVVVEPVPLPAASEAAASSVAVAAPAETPVSAAMPVPKAREVPKVVVPQKVEEKAASKPSIPAPPAPAVAPATGTEVKPPVALEMLKRRPLHFVFSGAAWIEVIDVNGDVLLSRSNLGGTEKWIGGPRRAPYDISIGNPGNVKLYYKGKEIDLSAYAGMDTARLKVE